MTILEKCDQIIDNTLWPFIEHNLSTDKVFSDLIAFYRENSGSRFIIRKPSNSVEPTLSFDHEDP